MPARLRSLWDRLLAQDDDVVPDACGTEAGPARSGGQFAHGRIVRLIEDDVFDNLRQRVSVFADREGLVFREPAWLYNAFVHSSFVLDHGLDDPTLHFERLEYLGDAVLGKIVAEYLFRALPHHLEGDLTRLRSELVRNATLTEWALELGLDGLVLTGPSVKSREILRSSRMLGSVFEALIGALYVDQGEQGVRRFLARWLNPAVDKAAKADGQSQQNAKSALQEVLQRDLGATPRYEKRSATGPSHQPEFEVAVTLEGRTLATGKGPSIQKAGFRAAEVALADYLAAQTEPDPID